MIQWYLNTPQCTAVQLTSNYIWSSGTLTPQCTVVQSTSKYTCKKNTKYFLQIFSIEQKVQCTDNFSLSFNALFQCPLSMPSFNALFQCPFSMPSFNALFQCPLSMPRYIYFSNTKNPLLRLGLGIISQLVSWTSH